MNEVLPNTILYIFFSDKDYLKKKRILKTMSLQKSKKGWFSIAEWPKKHQIGQNINI